MLEPDKWAEARTREVTMTEKLTVLYARVSKEEQDSLRGQRDRLLERCKTEGWPNAEVFEEAASSTQRPISILEILRSRIDTGRPKLNEVIRLGLDGKLDRLVVDDPNRLARDATERHVLQTLFQELGVEVVVLSLPSTGNPLSDYYTAEAKAMADGGFKEQLSLDVKRAKDAKAAEGRHQTAPPFGYLLEPERDSRGDLVVDARGRRVNRVVVVPEEADAVRRAFESYAEGWSLKKIAHRFNEEGFHTRSKWRRQERDDRGEVVIKEYPRPFAHTSISIMLANEFYAAYDDASVEPRRGTVVRNRHANSGKHKCITCGDDCVPPCMIHCARSTFEGQHESIVSQALYLRANGQRSRGRKVFEKRERRIRGNEFLLWRMAQCLDCDSPFYTFVEGGGYAYYRHREAVDCQYAGKLVGRSIPETDLEFLIQGELTRLIDVEKRWDLVQKLRRQSRLTSNSKVAEKLIAKRELEKKRLLLQHRKGFIGDADLEREVDVLNREITRLRPVEETPAPPHVRDSFDAFRREWRAAKGSADGVGRRRELLGTIVEAVYLDLSRRGRIVAVRPTPDYADFYFAGEDGRAPMDWLAWRAGAAPNPYERQEAKAEASQRLAEGATSPGRG